MEAGYRSYPCKRPLNVRGLNAVPRVDVSGGGRREKEGRTEVCRGDQEGMATVGQEDIPERGVSPKPNGGHFNKKGMMGSVCQMRLPVG